MKKLTASLTLMAILFSGTALATEISSTQDQKPQLGEKQRPGHPAKHKKDKQRFRFKDCDTNKDGVVTYEEYQACFPKGSKENFTTMDADKDGKITQEELTAWRESKRKEFDEKRKERRAELFKKCDKDGNGSLSLEEFTECTPPKPDPSKGQGKKHPRRGDGPGKPGDRPAKPGMTDNKTS